MMSDSERTCESCGERFVIPPAEAVFRSGRGLEMPGQCPACRAASRASRNIDLIALYERADTFSEHGGSRSSGRPSGENRTRGSRQGNVVQQRYATVCAACGAETLVPFVPRGDRPVYCKNCFNARKGR